MRSNTVSRRTALRTIGSLAAGSATLTSAASARRDNPSEDCEHPGRGSSIAPEALANRPDTYVSVVDRIVGGRWVTLLVEEDGELVDQLVVGREELPNVEEADVLLTTIEDGELTDHRTLHGITKQRKREAEERLDCLLERSDG